MTCWIGPNAYLASVPCRWNGWNNNVLDVFGVLRFSCWNSHFLIFLIQVRYALVESGYTHLLNQLSTRLSLLLTKH